MKNNRYFSILLIVLLIFSVFNSGCQRQGTNDVPPTTTSATNETPPPASASSPDGATSVPSTSSEDETPSPDTSPPDTPPEETEPTPPAQLFLVYFGDTQADPDTGDYSIITELFALAITPEAPPDLVVFGGDIINDGEDADEWRDFWQAAAPSLGGLTTAATRGNHDKTTLFADQFTYPAGAPADPAGGYFYSIEADPVFFIMLDSNIMGAANPHDIEWLEETLKSEAAQAAAWRIVVMHHPMWPVINYTNDITRAETMREHFLPIMEIFGVDLILCGHQHNYARNLPMSGETTAPPGSSGIVQIMAASGGKGTYPIGSFDYVTANANAPVYLHITADTASLTIVTYGQNGEPIDNLSITK